MENVLSFRTFCLWIVPALLISCGSNSTSSDNTEFIPVSVAAESVAFSCSDSFATLIANNVSHVNSGETYIFTGYQQISSINQDPIVARFDNEVLTWCRTDYDTTNDDGKGIGLLWQAADQLFGAFTVTGLQPGDSFQRFSSSGWLPGYGFGGGARVSVIVSINPETGDPQYATFVSALLSNNDTNFALLREFEVLEDRIRLRIDSGFSPRNPDGVGLMCTGSSPIDWTLDLTFDLQTALASSAQNCSE